MDRRIEFGNFILILTAVLIFAIDNYNSAIIYAIKNGDDNGISSISKDYSLDSTLPLPLPLPFNSHIADALKNNIQQINSNDLIPFP
jgi:hypothetical protein